MSTVKCALLCWLTAAAADQGTHLTIHQFMLQTPTSASLICLQIPLKTSMVSHQQMLWATKTKLWGRQIHLTADAKADIELPIITWSAYLSKSSDPCKAAAQDTSKKDKNSSYTNKLWSPANKRAQQYTLARPKHNWKQGVQIRNVMTQGGVGRWCLQLCMLSSFFSKFFCSLNPFIPSQWICIAINQLKAFSPPPILTLSVNAEVYYNFCKTGKLWTSLRAPSLAKTAVITPSLYLFPLSLSKPLTKAQGSSRGWLCSGYQWPGLDLLFFSVSKDDA